MVIKIKNSGLITYFDIMLAYDIINYILEYDPSRNYNFYS